MKTKIILEKLLKFNKSWKVKKAHRVVQLIQEVINSEAFKREVLHFEFTDRRYRKDPNDEYREVTSNQEIYDIMMKGNEQYRKRSDDAVWNFKIKLGRFSTAIGHRDRDGFVTQNWFYRKDNDFAVAGHWVHEYSHVLGFTHDYERTPRRKDSVPYALGYIVERLLKDAHQK